MRNLKKNTHTLTEGSIWKGILLFALPLLGSSLIQQLYSTVDLIFVGQLLGTKASAAIGASGLIVTCLIGFFNGMAVGTNVFAARHYGAKRFNELKKLIQTIFWTGIIGGLLLMVIGLIFSPAFLTWMGTPKRIFPLAVRYLRIYMVSMISIVSYNLLGGVLRALGDSRTPLLYQFFGGIINVFADFIFLAVFHMGVGGAALATVISQGLSAILSFIYIKKKFTILKPSKEEMKYDKSLSKVLLRVGLPGAFQYSITAISCILVQASLNNFGSDSVAAYSVANKIENMVTQFYPALGIGISTFAGQNLGAGELKRVRKGFRVSVYMNIAYSILAFFICQFFASPMTKLFVDSNTSSPLVIEESILYVTTMSIFFIPLGFIFIFRTGCQGLGSGKIPMLSAIIELIARATTAFSLPYFFGFLGICLSNAVSWIGAGFILPFVYLAFMRKLERRNEEIEIKS